ncbi:MAG: exo-alpha-sialidase [Clostridia bacterium]|nr:exo-alpha-sialidase [Clostridia bacterium]
MIKQYTVSRDDSCYEAWPDITVNSRGEYICVFTECEHHKTRKNVRLSITKSRDKGITWDKKSAFTDVCEGESTFNNARINMLPDESMVINCDRTVDDGRGGSVQYIWRSYDDGDTWSEPEILDIDGIVPDKYRVLSNGRHIFGVHRRGESGKLEQFGYYSDDCGKNWTEVKIAADERYNLCEVCIVEVEEGCLVAFMRENSNKGIPCLKAISKDYGTTWEGVFETNIDSCHRPVVGFYDNGKLLMTYRFMHGGKGWLGHWTQNLFGAFFTVESALATERKNHQARIFPIAYDRSDVSDTGYSGWACTDKKNFYVVNYLVDDAPKAQIRGYSFSIDDVIVHCD